MFAASVYGLQLHPVLCIRSLASGPLHSLFAANNPPHPPVVLSDFSAVR